MGIILIITILTIFLNVFSEFYRQWKQNEEIKEAIEFSRKFVRDAEQEFSESLGKETTYTATKSGTYTILDGRGQRTEQLNAGESIIVSSPAGISLGPPVTGYTYSKKMPFSPMGGFGDKEQERIYREYCRCAKLHDDAEKAYLNYSPGTDGEK